jgi:hypothetical protein
MSPHVRQVLLTEMKRLKAERDKAGENESYHVNMTTEYREQRIIAEQTIDEVRRALLALDLEIASPT